MFNSRSDLEFLPQEELILSVSELTRQIKGTLELTFKDVWIRGEVSNLRQQGSGHVYFSLKDDKSVISVVLFRGDAQRLRMRFKVGDELIIYGRLNVYEPRGSYQVIARWMMDAGDGMLRQRFETMKRQLAAEGLFDPERKQTIPTMPQTVAMVTSPSGAAVQDFISVMRKRAWSGRLILFPALVQGNTAASSMVKALDAIRQRDDIDLVVLMRGGGSLEDLWAFNEESLARAIADFPLPVISAVGHEIDYSLSDFVADYRAETPTAAAEYITNHWSAYQQHYRDLKRRFFRLQKQEWEEIQERVSRLSNQLKGLRPERQLDRHWMRLDDLRDRMELVLNQRIGVKKTEALHLKERLESNFPERAVAQEQMHLTQLRARLEAADPARVIKRGYALLKNDEGKILSSVRKVDAEKPFWVHLRDGRIKVRSVVED